MRAAGVALGIAVVLAACAGPDPQPIDAPEAPTDAADAIAVDAPDLDAPDLDAPIDAADLDAPIDAADLDAPIDAADLDAPTDAPTDAALDAPTDAALDAPTDAAIDAPDLSWLDGWPMPQPPQVLGSAVGTKLCAAAGEAHMAWGVNTQGPSMSGTAVYRDGIQLYQQSAAHLLDCSVGITGTGTLTWLLTRAAGRVYEEAAGFATLYDPRDVVAIDPAGGSLVLQQDATSVWLLVHLTAALAVDPAFGTGGTLVVGGPVLERAVQLDGAGAPVVTLHVGTTLRRLALRTGAAVTSFGGTGAVAMPAVPGALIGLTPLPDLGVAVVSRAAAADTLAITRLDASGTAEPTQLVPVGGEIKSAAVDGHGRVVVGLVTTGPGVRLTRVLAATGAIDPGFGAAGRATATLAYTCPVNTTFAGGDWSVLGALGDGRVALGLALTCYAMPPTFYGNARFTVALFTD